ncbi:hypothetical protein H8356DRAFT_1429687 [Neocallimastix lanati (nom. inval.)]|nr:hypothetical protein H8356DRAFT_1429687 [Neocallimastix sp. JGI-2020a]
MENIDETNELVKKIREELEKDFDQDVIDLANKIQDIEIYDSKIDELFKTIFGNPRNKDITIRFLKDLINLDINEDEIINFLDKENLFNINIEIKSNQSKINIQNIDQGASSSNSETAIQQTKQIKHGHKFFHNFNINCKDIDKKYENIEIYIIELARFDINDFDDKIDKNLWVAFLKLPVNHLSQDFIEKLSRIKEIERAIEVCRKKPKKYENYQKLFSMDEKINELENQIDELKNETDILQNENDIL